MLFRSTKYRWPSTSCRTAGLCSFKCLNRQAVSRSATPFDETSDDIANCRCQYSVLKHSCVYSGDQPAKLDKLRHGAKTFQIPFNTLHLTKKSKNCTKWRSAGPMARGHGPWKPWHSPCSWKSADSWRPTV